MKNKKIKKLIAAVMITSAMTAILPAVLNPVPAYALSMTSADDVSMTSAQAHDAGFSIDLIDGGSNFQITRFDTSKGGKVIIPSKIDGKPVTQIGNYAFNNCKNLTSATIPNSVTSIGEEAFNNCYNLTAVIIPDSVTSIGEEAFYNCISLTAVIIPDSVTSIGKNAFWYCPKLISVTILGNVTYIGNSAFASIGSNAKFYVPNPQMESRLRSAYAGINVTVYTNIVTSINSINDITVDNGRAKENIGLPTNINMSLSNATTTSAAVSWDNGTSISDWTSYNGNEVGTYMFTGILTMPDGVVNPNNLKARVNVIVKAKNNPVSEITPAAVTIVGTEKSGNTLSAELLDNQNNPCTTSAAVTYQWYRLNNQNDGFSNVIGTGKTYTLTDADAGKYIGLNAELSGKSFTAVSGLVQGNVVNNNPSNNSNNNTNSSSGSSSSHHHSDATTDDETASANGSSSQGAQATSADGWEYFQSGKPVAGWQQIKGNWYLFDSLGIMQVGWRQVNGVLYLLKDNGAMAIGWQQVNSKWYFMKDNGAMAKGWQEINGIWYLLKDDGSMTIGWQMSNGEWYYLYSDGAMARDTSVDGYAIGENGAWIQ